MRIATRNMDAIERETIYSERASKRASEAWPYRCRCGSMDKRTEKVAINPRRTVSMWICRSCGAKLGPAIADARWLDQWYRSRESRNA